jgi:hypothetical protein
MLRRDVFLAAAAIWRRRRGRSIFNLLADAADRAPERRNATDKSTGNDHLSVCPKLSSPFEQD